MPFRARYFHIFTSPLRSLRWQRQSRRNRLLANFIIVKHILRLMRISQLVGFLLSCSHCWIFACKWLTFELTHFEVWTCCNKYTVTVWMQTQDKYSWITIFSKCRFLPRNKHVNESLKRSRWRREQEIHRKWAKLNTCQHNPLFTRIIIVTSFS